MYSENAKERHREFIEGLRKSYNLTADNAISTAETFKIIAQVYQPHNIYLINHWQTAESELRKFKKVVNAYYDIRVSDYP